MTVPIDDDGTGENGDGFEVIRRFHYVFTENGLERSSPDPADKTKLIRIVLDIPEAVYRRVMEIAKSRDMTIETVICESLTGLTELPEPAV